MRVQGNSMSPRIQDGDFVLCVRTIFLKRLIKLGNVYVIKLKKHKYCGKVIEEHLLIKRLIMMDKDSGFYVGDNLRHSYDSREFGNLPHSDNIALVIKIIYRRKKRGSVCN